MNYRAKGENGFTLMEMMTVIGIIAVLSVLAFPSMLEYRDNIKLRDAIVSVKSDLERAKSIAISRRIDVTVQFMVSGYNITTLGTIKLPDGVILDLANVDFTLAGNNTGFNNRGMPINLINDSGDIVLRNRAGKLKKVHITPLGLIKVL